jgi:hypothetical protein
MLDTIKESLRQLRDERTPKTQGGITESLRQLRSEPPKPEQSFWENFKAGTAQGLNDYILSPALSLAEAAGSAATGDFRPLGEMAELAGRGLLKTVSAFDPAGNAYEPTAAEQDPKIQAIQAEREKRHRYAHGFEDLRIVREQLEREASANPSFSNKAARFIGSGAVAAAPAIATGVLTGGSLPAVAGTAALQSASQPENLALNVGGSVAPLPPVKAFVSPILRRIRGGKATPTSPVEVTKPLPELQGPGRPTSRLPQLIDEGDPTQGLREVTRPPAATIRGETESLPSLQMSTSGPRALFEGELRDIPLESLVSQAERTPMLETISALRKAGLLTGLKTHIKNVGGTGLFQLSEEASRIPASIVDMALSTVTKQRTLSGPSLQSMARSAREAATKGVSEAREIIRKGTSDADLERLQLPKEINSGSKVLDGYVNGVFRLLNAEDRLFKTFAMRRSLEDRARVMALNEMKQRAVSPKEFMGRIDDLVANPPESMVADAIADAEIATFTEANRISEGISAFKAKQGPVGQFAVDMAVPFTKTPSNIIGQMLNYSPYGFGKNVFQLGKAVVDRAMTPGQQRDFAQTFGRASVGSSLIALGWYLGDRGLMTGLIEDEPSKRARDQAAGRLPGSILIGDHWHQLLGFAPLGSLLAIGATLARETKQESEDTGLMPTLEVAGQAIGEQPLLIGSKQIGEAITKPGSVGEKLLGGLAGSFVPTIASDIAEGIDPQQRETKGEGILGQAQKRIPFLRESLPPSIDVLGEPRQDFGPGQALLDPTRTTTDVTQSNPLFAELVRLDQGLSGFKQKAGETVETYQSRVREFGRLYSTYGLQLINSPQYRATSDEDRRELFSILNRKAKALVDEGDQREAPARLNPQALFDGLRRKKEKK